jgi:hypothetical protein
MRGLKKTSRHQLLAAKRFNPTGAAPPTQVVVIPTKLSMWGNDKYGDCVSASEAARKAAYSVFCGLPETFIPESNVIAWAQRYGYLNGANLTDVMTTMQTNGMAADDGKTYTDGPYAGVDYSKPDLLRAALAVGPVNLGIDANALPPGAGNGQGWFASGGAPGQFQNEDHCVPLFGYGPVPVLFTELSKAFNITVAPPPNAPAVGYLIFTWSTIGVVDDAWIMSTVGEAWVQNPTTPGQSPSPVPNPNPDPNPPPGPGPGPQTITFTFQFTPAPYTFSTGGFRSKTVTVTPPAQTVTATGTINQSK